MTISSLINRISYSGDGSTTVFPFPYYFIEETDLLVILRVDSTGVETTKVITTNYTVSGAGNQSGGSVTMLVAPVVGETLTIIRDTPATQELDLVENDSLPAEPLEQELDRLTMALQRVQDKMDRSAILTDGNPLVFDPTLPSLIVADTVLAFNSSGDGFATGPSITDIAAAAANAAAAAASAAAAAASASTAASSATAAATSATNAATSATNAAASAVAAAASAAAAAAAGGGGGGGSHWTEGAAAPIYNIETDIEVYNYEAGQAQDLFRVLKVISGYTAGNPIKMKIPFLSNDTSGNALIRAQASLVRPGTDQITSTTNQRTTTNTAVTLSGGTQEKPQIVTLDLSSTIGQINGVAISPGDFIRVRLYRDSDTATSDIRVMHNEAEVTFS